MTVSAKPLTHSLPAQSTTAPDAPRERGAATSSLDRAGDRASAMAVEQMADRPTTATAESARLVVRASELLEPVRAGLERVEARLQRVESSGDNGAASLFTPLSHAFLTLIGSGGKRLRPALALLAAEMNPARGPLQGTVDYERTVALAAAVEMLHTATLVHDDVIDGALLRRGAPTLNASWSGGSTVLAGNYMFGTAAQLSAETGNVRVIRIFADTLRVIVDGELRQLLDRFRFDQPRESYYQRIYAKTASLFCAATEGAALLSGQPEAGVKALRSYGYHLGMAFQIVDDILDFTSNASTLGKPAGSDLMQGTLTLPFFHYVHSRPDSADLISRLETAQLQADMGDALAWQALVGELVQELRTSSAIAAARAEADTLIDQARADLRDFPDTVYRRAMLGLCDFVVQRNF